MVDLSKDERNRRERDRALVWPWWLLLPAILTSPGALALTVGMPILVAVSVVAFTAGCTGVAWLMISTP